MKNLFEAFDPISKKEWIQKIEQDLKGAQFEESVVWKSDLGIEVQPFYHSEDLVTKDTSKFRLEAHQAVLAQEFVWSDDPKTLNKSILTALKFGVSSLIIDFATHSVKESHLLTTFKDVQTDLLDITFKHVRNVEEFKELLDTINFKAKSVCNIDSIPNSIIYSEEPRSDLIDVTEIGNDSASMVFELACGLAKGVERIENKEEKDNSFIQFNFVVAGNYFFEIAKLRAFRFLWKVIADEFKLQNEHCYIQSQLAKFNKSESDVHLNILRATTETMSAIMGGCDVILINSSSNKNSNQNDLRVYNNVFNMLQFESGVTKANDPAAGSYYIESLTEEITKRVWNQFLKIQDVGGFKIFAESSAFQEEIEKGKSRSSKRLAEIEKERNLYQS